ncbi:MAG: MoxR family ATPase [Bdellovibrionaceae bacterium]|nr:MoxR family ATPase [Pseudobdellovibrionaceae bacterium]
MSGSEVQNLNYFKKEKKLDELFSLVNQVIVDKEQVIKLSLTCLFANGHLLLEDRPGMGKTSLVKTLSKVLGLNSQRIQFTNDMLPADIIGTTIFNKEKATFDFHKGPIFSNFVLADEINRATPKTQSACLQAMEEYQVNMDGQAYDLPHPFFLVATQNPQENVGTFPLPESQLDRFLMKINLGLPSRKAEREIITGKDRRAWIDELPQIYSAAEVLKIIDEVKKVHFSPTMLDYLQDIVAKSRVLSVGLSPRAVIDFSRAAQSWAFIESRDFVIPEDIQAVAVAVMNHRLVSPNNAHNLNGFELANEIIQTVPVP